MAALLPFAVARHDTRTGRRSLATYVSHTPLKTISSYALAVTAGSELTAQFRAIVTNESGAISRADPQAPARRRSGSASPHSQKTLVTARLSSASPNSSRELSLASEWFTNLTLPLARPECDGADVHLDLQIAGHISPKVTACRSSRRSRVRDGDRPARDADGHDHWTLRLLAGKAVELGFVEQISPETIRALLKKTS
jgi:hypothetical protein